MLVFARITVEITLSAVRYAEGRERGPARIGPNPQAGQGRAARITTMRCVAGVRVRS